MQKRTSRKARRLALVLVAVVAGTAVIGWGGLAAWQAYTENDGNSVTAGTLGHENHVSANCASSATLPMASACAAILNVSGVSPSSPATLTSGTVKIDSTGSLNSTFTLSTVTQSTATVTAPSGGLCADLVLTVTDLNAGGPVYTGALSGAINNVSLNNNAATPSSTWTGGGTANTGTGPTGNTFTFTVTRGAGFNNNSADSGASCTTTFQFKQTSA
jgi:hypothetical protein